MARRVSLLLLVLAACCGPVLAQTWNGDLAGLYLTEDGGAQISVDAAGDGTYSGKIVWLRDEKDRLDKNNPDPARQKAPVLGLVIVRGMRPDAAARQWVGGTVYDPKNGKTYDAYLWRDPARPGVLHLKGYVLGIRWLGRSTSWTVEKTRRD